MKNLDDFRAELMGFTMSVGGLLPGLRPDARGALVKWMRLRNSLLFVLDFDAFESEEEQAGTPGTWHSFELDAPVDDLLAETGLHYVALAAAADVSPQSIIGDRRRGDGIGVGTLAARCEAAGLRLVLKVEKAK